MKVAAWAYPIEQLASFDAWCAKLGAGLAEAAAGGARLCVLPEYASMELTSLLAAEDQATLATQLVALQRLLPAYDRACREAAMAAGLTVVAGSFPVQQADRSFRNRLLVIAPDGTSAPIEKLQMTRFERELWGISPGDAQAVLDLGDGLRLGVAICYDAEFPLIARRLVAAGANVLAVPSCTDALAGYHRVRIAAQARALENQCYVIQAPTVGLAPWSIAVDENVGAAGVFAPSDRGFPADGVVALGALDRPEVLVTELDLARLDDVRADGQVLGHRDWDQPRHLGGEVARVRLGR